MSAASDTEKQVKRVDAASADVHFDKRMKIRRGLSKYLDFEKWRSDEEKKRQLKREDEQEGV